MKKMTKTLAISSAIAAGVMMATASDVYAKKGKMEKCYGVAKAGKNDCAAGKSPAKKSLADLSKNPKPNLSFPSVMSAQAGITSSVVLSCNHSLPKQALA